MFRGYYLHGGRRYAGVPLGRQALAQSADSKTGTKRAGWRRTGLCRARLPGRALRLATTGVSRWPNARTVSRWAILRTPDAGYCTKRGTGAPSFAGVSCASASACIGVGTIQPLNEGQIARPLTERWNGLRWSMQRTGEVTSALSCPAVGSCTAVGVQPPLVNAERWNGIRWTAQPLPVPRTPELGWSLDAVSCASPTRCIAVGGLTDTLPEERPLVAEYRGSAR